MPIHVIGQMNKKYIVVMTKEIDADNVITRMNKELGTMWSIMNTPYYAKASYPDMDEWDIDDMVLRTMLKHGVENVRGGSYQDEALSDTDITIAERNVKALKIKYAVPIQKVMRGYIVRNAAV